MALPRRPSPDLTHGPRAIQEERSPLDPAFRRRGPVGLGHSPIGVGEQDQARSILEPDQRVGGIRRDPHHVPIQPRELREQRLKPPRLLPAPRRTGAGEEAQDDILTAQILERHIVAGGGSQ